MSRMQIEKGQELMLPDIKPCTDEYGETGEGCTLCYREADDDVSARAAPPHRRFNKLKQRQMVVCDECGVWQHIDCQDRWGLYFQRIGGKDLCCYCHNNWPETDDGTGYYKIASEQSQFNS